LSLGLSIRAAITAIALQPASSHVVKPSAEWPAPLFFNSRDKPVIDTSVYCGADVFPFGFPASFHALIFAQISQHFKSYIPTIALCLKKGRVTLLLKVARQSTGNWIKLATF